MAWLLLVSAIETAASYYRKPDDNTDLPKKLEELVESHNCDVLINKPLAEYLKKYTGATSKFLKFILDFLPTEPEGRPQENFRIAYTKGKLRAALSKIYDYRSKALHSGIAFAYPICSPTGKLYNEERPLGATSAQNARWA